MNPFQSMRAFSTSSNVQRAYNIIVKRAVAVKPEYKVGDALPLNFPKKRAETPEYKYGKRTSFGISNRGLLGGQFPQTGHRVSEHKGKVRRVWLPNIQKKKLWSETLEKTLKFPVTTRVLRTINKEGGLDNYLTKDKAARIKELGPFGWKLRYQILKKKEFLKSPPHKDARVITSPDGTKVTVYYENIKVDQIDEPLNITIGRRKLLSLLYQLEKREAKAVGDDLKLVDFTETYRKTPASDIVANLAKLGHDFKEITVSL